jgi:paraquat-inducible protein A
VRPEPGALAFAGVVLITMFAAQCFDPRVMWRAALPKPQPDSTP